MAEETKTRFIPQWKNPRTEPNEADPQERVKSFTEVDLGFSVQDAIAEANRCLDCAKPLCVPGCPVQIDIPTFIRQIREEDFEGALATIKQTNMFPSVCGRVCPQEVQCEGACILNKRSTPIAIGQLERFLGDMAPEIGEAPVCAMPIGKKVAVIGAGPSGLACAGELSRRGYSVVVYEALHQGGGVLSYGIPEFRLPTDIVARELDDLCDIDVTIELDSVGGRLFTAEELLEEEGFSAVYIAVGAGLPIFMGIPGENANGVFSANEFLTRVNLMHANEFPAYDTPVIRGKKFVVVGGGNVAMDAARTALRMGADSVKLMYRRTVDEMPARRAEVHHAQEEGIEFFTLTAPIEVLTDEYGFVNGITYERMELGEPDESGRRRPVRIEDSAESMECDVVIVAIGTRSNPQVPLMSPDLETTDRGYIMTNDRGRTSVEGVWAGGDIVTGAATVILAMGAGRQAAADIDEWIQENDK